jgi:hypothetical protein
LGAYLITNSFVYVVNSIGETEIDSEKPFSREQLSHLFASLRETAKVTASFGHEGRNCDFLFQTDLDELETYLGTEVSEPDDDHLFQSVFKNPSFSSSLVCYIRERLTTKTLSKAVSISREIIDSANDFAALLIKQGLFFEFLEQAFDVVCELDSSEYFFSLWLLPLTLLRFTWGRGPEQIRARIVPFVDSYRSGEFRPFLYRLLQIPTDSAYPAFEEGSPYLECLAFPSKLEHNSDALETYFSQLRTKPYLWPSALVWGLETAIRNLKKLMHEQFPNSPLLNFLYFNMMMRSIGPGKPWVCALEKLDIPLMRLYPPTQISDINAVLTDHLHLLSRVTSIPSQDLSSILTLWRTWSVIFGWPEFLSHLLDRIVAKTAHILVPQDTRNLFQSVGYLMPIMVESDTDMTNTILEVVLDIVDNRLEGITTAMGLAEFCLVVVCTCPEKWEQNFRKLAGRAVALLQEDQCVRQPKSVFARCFLKRGLYASPLRERVVEMGVDVFRAINDWQTMIDFFIVKHIIAQSQKETGE